MKIIREVKLFLSMYFRTVKGLRVLRKLQHEFPSYILDIELRGVATGVRLKLIFSPETSLEQKAALYNEAIARLRMAGLVIRVPAKSGASQGV